MLVHFTMADAWVTRWRMQVSPTPVLPGVWRLKGGGFVVNAQIAHEPRTTGERPKYRTIFRVLRDVPSAKDAFEWLAIERRRNPDQPAMPVWKDFALDLFERRVAAGDMRSPSGIDSSRVSLANVIRTAPWSSLPVDAVRHADVQDWRDTLPTLTWQWTTKYKTGEIRVTRTGKYGPRTMNKMLGVARLVWRAAVVRFDLARNPMDAISDFSTKLVKTYTVEEPNALNPRTEIAEFLRRFKARFPQSYAFVLLGFTLGQRPCTIRPLRRKGPNADLDLVNKRLYIRRSNTFGQAIMDTTKTGNELTLSLPDELLAVLEEHIAEIERIPICRRSEYLFPNRRTGLMMSEAFLDKPFRIIMAEMGLTRKLTPRAMRRTYQDLADEAQLRPVAAMAVSGHKTLRMKVRSRPAPS